MVLDAVCELVTLGGYAPKGLALFVLSVAVVVILIGGGYTGTLGVVFWPAIALIVLFVAVLIC